MNRKLDIQIAKAKGLDVVGELYAWQDEYGQWKMGNNGHPSNLHPVYVKRCLCDLYDKDDAIQEEVEREWSIKVFGHYEYCLNVVPFWSSDLNTAWQLVDEMIDSGLVVSVEGDLGYWCTGYGDMSACLSYVEGDTPQESICKAYLVYLTRNEK
jgi:hypothetical protein